MQAQVMMLLMLSQGLCILLVLYWAKVGRHPYWPCMVSYGPYKGIFYKRSKGKAGEIDMYHVQYFGKDICHGWTTARYFPYEGKNKYFAKKDRETNEATSSSEKKKLKLKYHVSSNVRPNWLVAVEEADKATRYRIEDRFELFVFKYDSILKKKKVPTAPKKRRRRRRRFTTAPRKVKPMVSQPSAIVEPLCYYCEKGAVNVVCKSGFCTLSYHKECLGIKKLPKDFICNNCSYENLQPCIVCKAIPGTQKCSKCANYYHSYCLNSYGCARKAQNICSAHCCWSCYMIDPISTMRKAGNESDTSFVKCFRCPTVFHATKKCIPVGCAMLSPKDIICPHHFMGKNRMSPQGVINVNFCSRCLTGGELVCCESCPNAYHAECMTDDVPAHDYYCDDCMSKKYLYPGMLIWAKSGSFGWWPAELLTNDDLPNNIKKLFMYDGEFPVRFFGSDEYDWLPRGKVFPYTELNQNVRLASSAATSRSLQIKFQISREEAALALTERKLRMYQDVQIFQDSSKPPPFKHIRVNRAIPPAVIYYVPQSACTCSAEDENPCGPDNMCLNRTLMCECSPDNCEAGSNCLNQRFQKRDYAPVKVFKTKKRGWGLRARQFIPKGRFVIEYVGDVITQELYLERAEEMRKRNEQNYYFLLLDRGRLIDAGPRGNLSRFINHSCNPNCAMEKWSVNGDMRIGIFALADILKGEEVTFNYQSDVKGGQECFCGERNCLGIIGKNGKKKAKKN